MKMRFEKNDMRSLLMRLLLALGALSLSSCAYHEVMQERNEENYQLRRQLEAEQRRGEELSR